MAAKHAENTRSVVTCRIEPSLLERLDKVSEKEERSRSEMIERAVRELVERHERKRGAK
jgi:metal-responsive CopG/Arc/MetJ family transcriptional regulator